MAGGSRFVLHALWRGAGQLAPVWVLLIGLAATLLTYRSLCERELGLARSYFRGEAAARAAAIGAEISNVADALYAVRSLFDASYEVERGEFQIFADKMLERHTVVLALDWLPRVAGEDLKGFVSSARGDIGPEFTVLGIGEDDGLVPAPLADVHFPILYSRGVAVTRPIHGFDHASEAVRREAMKRAAQKNEPVASGRAELIRLPEGIGDRGGVVVYLPVYTLGYGPEGGSAFGGELEGFVAATVRLSGLIGAALQNAPGGAIDIQLFDDSGVAGPSLVFSHESHRSGTGAGGRPDERGGDFRHEIAFSPAGRDWRAVFVTADGAAYMPPMRVSGWALVFGVLLTAAALVYVQLLRSARARSEALVLARTAELRERSERLRAILNTAPDAVIVSDDRGVIESVNPAAERCFGYCEDELVERCLTLLMPERLHELHRARMQRYLDRGPGRVVGAGAMRTYGLRKDGLEFPIELSIGEVRLADRRLFTWIIRDVTEHKQAEDAIRRLNTELEERVAQRTEELHRTVDELRQFASIASHDLQEPLRKVRVFGDRVRLQYGEALGEKGLDYLGRMLNATERMAVLLNDLLSLTRVTSTARAFCRVDLGAVLGGVLSDLEVRIQETGARVEAAPLPEVDADPTQMRQLFQNLIANALKYRSEERAPVVEVRAEAVGPERGGEPRAWLISVRDNGIGFDPGLAPVIFEPFRQLHGRSEYEGSGMGLAICRKIVVRHGGSIEAHGRVGEGAEFVIELPARHDLFEGTTCQSNAEPSPSSSRKTTPTTV